MSHVLRAAVAATSLFAFSACASTGSLDRNFAEAIQTATGTGRFDPTPPGAAPSAAAPAGATPTGGTPASGPAPPAGAPANGSAPTDPTSGPPAAAPTTTVTAPAGGISQLGRTTLTPVLADGIAETLPPTAWDVSRPVLNADGAGGFANLMFERPDSRLRIVLNVADAARGGGRGEASDAVTPAAGWMGSAAFWQTAPAAGAAEVLGLEAARVGLAMPTLDGSDVIVGWPVEPRHTPEPSSLALAALGLGGVGLARRLRRA